MVDGSPIVALAEERLNRVKYLAGFPRLSVLRCLEIAGLNFSDIDAVTVGRDSSANLHKKLEFAIRNPAKLLNLARIHSKSKTFDDLKNLISNECGVEQNQLKFKTYNVEHHLAHTASAYFASNWEHSAGITIDDSGDFVSCLLSECVGDEIKPLQRIFVPHSLGTLYTAVCQFIGYGKYGDEGKVMRLAVDDNENLKKTVSFNKGGQHPTLFMFGTIHFPYQNKLEDELYFQLVGVKEDNRTFRVKRG